jgi:tRNA(fMet)-specific endonuclease VapC
MIGSKCLLDTSVIIQTFRTLNTVSGILDDVAEVHVPIIVIGELFYGAFRSSDPAKHINRLQLFLSNCIVLHPDKQTAELYGKIKAALMQKGKPIPENDIWIAATALQSQLPLYKTDKHFREVDGIAFFAV